MPADGSTWASIIGVLAVLLLVAANGFFVASEFALVAVRRSRVAELVAKRRTNAKALERATDHLDAYLAATQLGITISSLALGWIGEPALAHLIEPLLLGLGDWANAGAHTAAVIISFVIITALHIVLGELAPKSLALQRSEETSLVIVRPLGFFLFILRPAILVLNGLGNQVLKLCGLQPGTGEGSLHSPEELKLLVSASEEGGLLETAQREVVSRVLGLGERRVADIMTPRIDVEWVDLDDSLEEQLKTLRACRHEQLFVAKGALDDPLGIIVKTDLLDSVLDGTTPDLEALIRAPVVLHETTPILLAFEHFKKAPVRAAMVIDEYGTLQGIITQTDLLEAIAGEIPSPDGALPDIHEEAPGVLLINGLTPAHEAYDRLGIEADEDGDDFHTMAGFVLDRLGHIPEAGEQLEAAGWTFTIMELDGRRIALIRAERDER